MKFTTATSEFLIGRPIIMELSAPPYILMKFVSIRCFAAANLALLAFHGMESLFYHSVSYFF